MAAPPAAALDWFLTADERGNPSTRLDARRDVDASTPVAPAWTEGNAARPHIDGAEYFGRLLEVFATLGPGDWVYISDLEGNADELLDGPGTELGSVLARLAEGGVEVRGLLWRSHATFNQVDNLLLTRKVNSAGGHMLLDNRVRRGGSHHQKIVVVRRRDPSEDLAFVGGIDLAHGRRDGPDHDGDPQRAELDDSNYGPHPPWHDVHVEIRGPAVDDVAYTFRERWEDPAPLDARNPVRAVLRRLARQHEEPKRLAPDVTPPACGDVAVQVLRTYPARRRSYPFARGGERSIARAYTKVFGRARAFIYLEDQYLWSFDAARELAEALRRSPDLRLVVVVPRHADPDGRFTGPASRHGRHRVLRQLYEAGGDRVAVYDLENAAGTPIYVHSKVCVVDDLWLAIGSDNLNRRSWTHDSEISCAMIDGEHDPRAPHDPAANGLGARRLAREVRLRLAAEHLGRSPDAIDDLVDPAGWFDAMREAADALDSWHAAGGDEAPGAGPRPSGHLRAHPTEPPERGPIVRLLHTHLLDPDGRPRHVRASDRHGF